MIPGMNPRELQKAMKRLGIRQEEIDANEVIIRADDKEIIISNPQVSKVNMMGQETFQIVGQAEERPVSSEPEISQDDIETVVQQTGAEEEQAKEAIEKNKGDLAKAILELKGSAKI
ncbi:nascent polypeptide-associated complex protein [Candidatus Woesearchaeota archaeon]|nr:nascent polypeptide-associated complex protein [Candidatus Woesearchaeota archaeon]